MNIQSRPAFFIFFLFLLVFLVPATAVKAEERIQDVKVELQKNDILVSARLSGGFSKEIMKDIHNGIPKDFYYYLLVQRTEKRWFDEEMASKTLRYTVKYDTLKKNYLITRMIDNEEKKQEVPDFKSMKKIVSRVDKLKVASITELRRQNRLYASVKVQMQAAERPFYLDYFLFFVPFLEIDTPWADSPTISLEKQP